MKLWNKSEQIAGFFDQGISITGEVRFSGILRIDGNFHGSIASPDTLIIGEHSVVHADINVGDLVIHGQVFGNVEVKRRTEISSSGQLRGDLQTSSLIVEVGAILDGRSRMPSDAANSGCIPESSEYADGDIDNRKREIDLSTQG